MANPHSSVIYVEPNSMDYDWNSDKTIEKASRLEDYCIALNIEVEEKILKKRLFCLVGTTTKTRLVL